MNKTLILATLALALGSSALPTHAATLNNGDMLTITTGIPTYDSNGDLISVSGSWFAYDQNNDGIIETTEREICSYLSQGTSGLVIGITTLAGASHGGNPTAGDTNAIDAPYSFFSNTGSDFTTIGITGGTTTGLDMSGWRWTWNGIAPVNMGSGGWGAGFTSGIGHFVWDGTYGHAYTLDYHATVAPGDPSSLGGIRFAWHYEGVVAVPEASTYGMMLAGLMLVGFAVQRRRAS